MENFTQIESKILNRISNIKDRNSYDVIKTEIFGNPKPEKIIFENPEP